MMEREGLEIIDWTEGQADCKAEREDKSKPEEERLRGVVEKTARAEDVTGSGLEGRDRVLATTFSEPGMWTMLLVNSEI